MAEPDSSESAGSWFAQAVRAFLDEKRPKTEVERIVCLAHCMTHLSHQSEFTASDIAALASDAGLPRLSNPSFVVRKAVARGLIAQTTGNKRRITAEGEEIVLRLPS